MENILNFIVEGTSGPSSAVLFGAIFFTFMCMFFFVLAVTDVVQRRSDIRKRATYDISRDYSGIALDQPWEATDRSLRFQSYAENSALLGKIERGRRNQANETEKSRLERELVSAGFFGPNSVHPDWGAGLLGDKAHSVIFDNTKIRRLVPDFRATTAFHVGAAQIVSYYRQNEGAQRVDADIDALMDELCAQWGARA
jgi:hypothetical protein